MRCIISHPHRLSLQVLRCGLLGSYKFALKRGETNVHNLITPKLSLILS